MAFRICSCGRKINQPVNSTIWPKRCASCDHALKSKRAKKIKEVSTKGVNIKVSTKPKGVKVVNRKLDEAWSLLVKIRAGYKCEYCGSERELNSHHIYSRANFATRWDVENGICLCVGHHTFNNQFSAHRTPIEFTKWLEKVKGVDFLLALKFKALSRQNLGMDDKLELLQNFKEEIKKSEE